MGDERLAEDRWAGVERGQLEEGVSVVGLRWSDRHVERTARAVGGERAGRLGMAKRGRRLTSLDFLALV
jgi:hypothetical protein